MLRDVYSQETALNLGNSFKLFNLLYFSKFLFITKITNLFILRNNICKDGCKFLGEGFKALT